MSAPRPTQRRHRKLTARQLDVLQAVADGDTQREIAAALWVQPPAISQTLQAVRIKLGASTNASAVAIAVRTGLIT